MPNTWTTKRHAHTSAAATMSYDTYRDAFDVTVAISGCESDPGWHFTETTSFALTARGGKRSAERYMMGHLNRSDW